MSVYLHLKDTIIQSVNSHMYVSDSSLFINCGGEAVEVGKDTYEEDLNNKGASIFMTVNDRWGYSSSGTWIGDDTVPYLATDDRFNLLNESVPQYYKRARLAPQSLKYYGLCLRSESYKLQLHFAEIMFSNDQTYSSIGRRIFDIYVQVSFIWQNEKKSQSLYLFVLTRERSVVAAGELVGEGL